MKIEPPPLRQYQADDLAYHIANPKSLNLSEPSTGKTPTVCVLAYYHWVKHKRKTIWTMPVSLMEKNKEEMALFTGFDIDDIHIFGSAHGNLTKKWTGPTTTIVKKRRVKTGMLGPDGKEITKWDHYDAKVKDLIAEAKDAKVFISSFSFLRDNWKHLFATIPEIDNFMVDELHMGYGGPSSKQTASFWQTGRKCSQFCGMTGTLIDGRLDSAYPAIHLIEPNYYGSYNGFIDSHAAWIDDYGNVDSWKDHDKLRQIIDRHSIRHTRKEVYGDQPIHFQTRMVEMGEKCRESYKLFHDQAMLELEDDNFLDGALPGVATIRARQIMAHPETNGIAKGETTGKDRFLAEVAAEGQPMLVFAALKPEQRRSLEVLKACGMTADIINSDTSTKDRDRIDKAFRAGELDAIVASGPTAAVGYNWERADHVIFISIDYKDVNVSQAYLRASRGTRTTTLLVTFVQYADSIDQRQYAIVKAKSEEAHKVDPTREVLNFG